MKTVRKIIEINEELCNGCGQCVHDCAEGSLKIIDGKARLVADKFCDGLGACLGSCPTGALQIVEREAEEFDEKAVEEYLEAEKMKAAAPVMDCGCASSHIQTLKPLSPCQQANKPISHQATGAQEASMLAHWPIQIRLVPPQAPFLQNADLLVAADCTAIAARGFQEKYLEGKAVLMGCPKFDDADSYVRRFADIIATCRLKSLTVLIMEVPCCSAMNSIIRKARDIAGVDLPVEQITISVRGEELARTRW